MPRYPPYIIRTLHTGTPGLPRITHMAFCGDTGEINADRVASSWVSWPALAPKVPNMQSKKRTGTERRHAKNVTQTAFWRTCAQNALENVTYFEHPEDLPKSEPKEGAKYVKHSSIS